MLPTTEREIIIKGLIALICDLSHFDSSNQYYNISISDQEFQLQEEGNMPELYFIGDFAEVGEAIKNVVQYLWKDEHKHWEEEGCPEGHVYENKHIFHSLQVLKQLIPNYQVI